MSRQYKKNEMNLTDKLSSPSRNRQVLKHEKNSDSRNKQNYVKVLLNSFYLLLFFLMIFSTVTEKFKLLLHYGKVLLVNFPLKLELPCSVYNKQWLRSCSLNDDT